MARSRRPLVPRSRSGCAVRSMMRRYATNWVHGPAPRRGTCCSSGCDWGVKPRCLVATTPRPTKLIRELLAREGGDVVVTRGSTYENRANLAPGFFDQVIRKYEGTRLGRQELNAEVLDDVPGALWTRARIEEARWPVGKSMPDLSRVVVAIDPAVTSGEEADETGIIVAGRDYDGRGYVLDDRSGRYAPFAWAREAIML